MCFSWMGLSVARGPSPGELEGLGGSVTMACNGLHGQYKCFTGLTGFSQYRPVFLMAAVIF